MFGSHAGWHQGLAERRGDLLGEVWNKVACDFHIKTRHEAQMALSMCLHAKSATVVRCGVTAEQTVPRSIVMVCTSQRMRKILSYLLHWEAMVQADWRRMFGQRQELRCWTRDLQGHRAALLRRAPTVKGMLFFGWRQKCTFSYRFRTKDDRGHTRKDGPDWQQ